MFEKFLDSVVQMMQKWDPIGQGFFLLILLGLAVGVFLSILRYFVIFFRGWPPAAAAEEEE